MMRNIVDLGLRLMLVCLIAAVGLGFTYGLVKDRIDEMERKQREEACAEVLAPIDAEPRENAELTSSLQESYPDLIGIFEGVNSSGEVVGHAFVVETKGYNFMTMAVGVDLEGKVTGVTVVTNEETPGLGGAVAQDREYLGQYEGMGPDPLLLGEDLDAVSGATFTSKGITNGVNMSLEIWADLRQSGGG